MYCAVANQQQQLNDWCSHQLPAAASSSVDQSAAGSTEEHHAVGLLTGQDYTGSVEVCIYCGLTNSFDFILAVGLFLQTIGATVGCLLCFYVAFFQPS